MNKEMLQKQIEEYRNEIKVTAENRDRMVQMVNQQDMKIQQLMGAIAALERVLTENSKEEKKNTQEVLPNEQVNDSPESAKS